MNAHTIRFEDTYELEAAAEAVYIEHELQARGDGMWRPWSDLDRRTQERWERKVVAAFRAINQRRMRATPAVVVGVESAEEKR